MVTARGRYNSVNNLTYDFNGELGAPFSVCGQGAKLRDGFIKSLSQFRREKPDGSLVNGIPYTTMAKWTKNVPGYDRPLWLVERDCRGRKTLKGDRSVIGRHGELRIAEIVIEEKQKATPLLKDDVTDLIRKTLIKMKAVDPVHHEPYHERSDVRRLKAQWERRTSTELGITWRETGAQGLSKARAQSASVPNLVAAEADVKPQLKAFQQKHGVIPVSNVANYDEFQFDSCAFAEEGVYIVADDGIPVQFLKPRERAEHITVLLIVYGSGLIGPMCVIIKGSSNFMPNQAHLHLIPEEDRWKIMLSQTDNAWVDGPIKYAFVKYQIDTNQNGIRTAPHLVNFDGQQTNTEIIDSEMDVDAVGESRTIGELLNKESMAMGQVLPAHMSHLLQLCDKRHGPIHTIKAELSRLLRRQQRASARVGRDVTIAELLCLLVRARDATVDALRTRNLTRACGYLNEPETGELVWVPTNTVDLAKLDPATNFGDLKRLEDVDADALAALDNVPGRQRSGLHRNEKAANVEIGRRKAAAVVEAVNAAHHNLSQPVVAFPTASIRGGSRKSRNTHGVIVTGEDYTQNLLTERREKQQKQQQKEAKAKEAEVERWEKARPRIEEAEAKLAAGTSPTKLQVQELKALVLSRTGRAPLAKNNKVPEKLPRGARREGALVAEWRTHSEKPSLVPPAPSLQQVRQAHLERQRQGAPGGGSSSSSAAGNSACVHALRSSLGSRKVCKFGSKCVMKFHTVQSGAAAELKLCGRVPGTQYLADGACGLFYHHLCAVEHGRGEPDGNFCGCPCTRPV